MRILLAIDGSGHSEAAVDAVARRRDRAETIVRVISVVDSNYATMLPDEGWDPALYEAIRQGAQQSARTAVDKARAALQLERGGRTVTADVVRGSPKQVILEEADAFDADLIVVGSHGHGALGRFLLGSVSQSVVLHAACSVEIVRSRTARMSGHGEGGSSLTAETSK